MVMDNKMSENYQRRRHFFIRTAVKVLTIILVTLVGTFLCIQYNHAQTTFSVHHNIDSDIKTQNHDTFFAVTNATAIIITTDASLDVTYAAQKQKEVQVTEDVTMVKERTLSNHSTFKDSQANSRSLNTDIDQEDNFIITPTISNRQIPLVHGNFIKENHSLINHKNVNRMVDDYEVYNENGTIDNDRLYHTMKNGYSTTEINTPVAEKEASNSYYNVNDLSYSADDYGYKEVKIPLEDIKWITNGQSEQMHIDESSLSESVGGSNSGSYGQNSYYDLKSRYPTGHTIYYRPSITIPKKLYQPSRELDTKFEKSRRRQPIYSKISWETIEILSLIKLGILKLKMIGFLQSIFLIGFKFKLFLMAIFFKFILLMKLLKFFKILILPVYIFSLFPILTSLYNRMVNMQSSNGLSGSISPGSSSSLPGLISGGGSSSSSTLPGLSSSSGGTSLLPGLSGASSGSNVLPGLSGGSSGGTRLPGLSGGSSGSTRLPGLTGSTLVPGISRDSTSTLLSDLSAIEIIPKGKQSHYFDFNIDDSNVFNKHNYKTLKFLDPVISIFQEFLSSEKCIERLACRIISGEKTGVIPLWINWILNGISIVIPNEKLKLYLKTYNDVNHFYTNKYRHQKIGKHGA